MILKHTCLHENVLKSSSQKNTKMNNLDLLSLLSCTQIIIELESVLTEAFLITYPEIFFKMFM